MSALFKFIAWIVGSIWELTPEGLQALWVSMPSGLHPIIILAVAIGLVAAAFRIDQFWLRIIMYLCAVVLITYLIAQSLSYFAG